MSQLQSYGVMQGPTQLEVDGFKMPPVELGVPVKWYKNGEIDGNPPLLAFVERATNRALVLRLSDGSRRETVRHIADPKLRLGKTQRDSGAWDYSDWYLETKKFQADVLARLHVLEISVAQLTRGVAAATDKKSDTTLADRIEAVEKKVKTLSAKEVKA